MSLATKIYLLGALALSMASADSLTVVNSNFSNVAVQCSLGYAYQSHMGGNCANGGNPQQDFNSAVGVGWTFFSNPTGANGDGLTDPNTLFDPPPFSGLPFNLAALLQGATGALEQTITGFVPGGMYTLDLYLGSRYASGSIDGNQTVEAAIDGQIIGTWKLVSSTPFTLQTAAFTVADGGPHILTFAGTTSGDHTAFFSSVGIETASSLTVSPSSGAPGIGVVASGSGFTPFETVNLVGYASTPTAIGRAAADASGNANVEGRLPQTPFGTCELQLVGQSSGTVASGTISISPRLTLSPKTGTPGETITAIGMGYGVGEEVSVYWLNPRTLFGNATTNRNGSFSVTFAIPSGTLLGPNEVIATGQRTGAVGGAKITVQ